MNRFLRFFGRFFDGGWGKTGCSLRCFDGEIVVDWVVIVVKKMVAFFRRKTRHILEIYFRVSGLGVTLRVLKLPDHVRLIVGMIRAGEAESCGHGLLALRDTA